MRGMIDYQALPLPLIFTVSLVLMLVANEVGRFARRRARVRGDDNVYTLEGAVLGLLALMIGFSFAMSLSHFDARRSAVLNEANAIGTTALRARLLPAPHNSESLTLLREYTQLRLDAAKTFKIVAELNPLIDRSNAIQEALWQQAKAVMAKDAGLVPTGLFIQSLNDMIDSQQKRLTAVRMRLPGMVLIALYGIAIVATGLIGYSSGLGLRRTYLPNYAVSLLVAAVILLVQDLDRPGTGFIKVDQQPMIDTANSLAGYKD
jgi:hypothetical protein